MLRRVQCAAVGVIRGRGLGDHLVEAHIAATRGRPQAVGARVFQVRICVAARAGMGVSSIAGVECSRGPRGVVHGELRRVVRRVAVDVNGVGRI